MNYFYVDSYQKKKQIEDLNCSHWMAGIEVAASEFAYTEEERLTWAYVHDVVGRRNM